MAVLAVMGTSPPVEQSRGWSPRRGADVGVLRVGRKPPFRGGGTVQPLLQACGRRSPSSSCPLRGPSALCLCQPRSLPQAPLPVQCADGGGPTGASSPTRIGGHVPLLPNPRAAAENMDRQDGGTVTDHFLRKGRASSLVLETSSPKPLQIELD